MTGVTDMLPLQVVFDIAGDDRKGLEVEDLLDLFEKQRGLEITDDSLLLG